MKNKYKVYVGRRGSRFRSLDGELHCTNRPAIEGVNGYKEWWVHGKCLFEKDT